MNKLAAAAWLASMAVFLVAGTIVGDDTVGTCAYLVAVAILAGHGISRLRG